MRALAVPLLAVLALAATGLSERAAAAPATFPAASDIHAARQWAADRRGRVAIAVVDNRGRLRGRKTRERFTAASVVKAMLLVAYLERRRGEPLDAADRALLDPMIRRSDNRAATAVYWIVRAGRLYRLARRAGMREFWVSPSGWSASITAADQARFFLRIDRLTPARHRAYARQLLSSIVAEQRWGIPQVTPPRFALFFKGGWLRHAGVRLVHQVALLEDGDERIAVAILTDGSPTYRYGMATLRGTAARLFGRR